MSELVAHEQVSKVRPLGMLDREAGIEDGQPREKIVVAAFEETIEATGG